MYGLTKRPQTCGIGFLGIDEGLCGRSGGAVGELELDFRLCSSVTGSCFLGKLETTGVDELLEEGQDEKLDSVCWMGVHVEEIIEYK